MIQVTAARSTQREEKTIISDTTKDRALKAPPDLRPGARKAALLGGVIPLVPDLIIHGMAHNHDHNHNHNHEAAKVIIPTKKIGAILRGAGKRQATHRHEAAHNKALEVKVVGAFLEGADPLVPDRIIPNMTRDRVQVEGAKAVIPMEGPAMRRVEGAKAVIPMEGPAMRREAMKAKAKYLCGRKNQVSGTEAKGTLLEKATPRVLGHLVLQTMGSDHPAREEAKVHLLM